MGLYLSNSLIPIWLHDPWKMDLSNSLIFTGFFNLVASSQYYVLINTGKGFENF